MSWFTRLKPGECIGKARRSRISTARFQGCPATVLGGSGVDLHAHGLHSSTQAKIGHPGNLNGENHAAVCHLFRKKE